MDPTLSEILIQLGEQREKYFNAVAPPIIQSSNFAFKNLKDFRTAFTDELENTIYTRGNNPTVKILRQKLAALERAEDALVFGSGAAAIANAVIANVKSGDHIVCVRSPYSWTQALLERLLSRFGVTHTYVDGRSTSEIEAAIQPNTTLLYLESPNSLTFELQDLAACVQLAKKYQLISCIDNSYCSPIFQQPIELGIDLVIHSVTKYLNGHSDVVMGVVCGSKALIKKIFETEFMTLGAIVSPHDAALVLRGLRTLAIRMQRIFDTTQQVVAYLEQHPKIRRVIYPYSDSFEQSELAHQQMSGSGGLFSIELDTDDLQKAEDFFHELKCFLLAVSWGGHESLVLPAAGFYQIPGRPDTTLPVGFLRFSIGLEAAEELIADLEKALAKV